MTSQGIHNAKVLLKEQTQKLKYMLVSTRVLNNTCGSWMFSFLMTHKAVGLVEFNNFCRAVGILLTKVFSILSRPPWSVVM